MFNVAICEDEKYHIDSLLKYFDNYEKVKNIKFNLDHFYSGEEFLKSDLNKYDIIILDINLVESNGMDVAKKIRVLNKSVKIVFVTALEKYCVEGYKVNAYRYFIKPFLEEEFIQCISELINEIRKESEYILIEENLSIIKLKIKDIYYIEIEGRKVAINSKMGIFLSKKSIRYWKEKLKIYGFSSPHNSYLVNMNYIEKINKEDMELTNGKVLYISKRKAKEFKNDFVGFIGDMF